MKKIIIGMLAMLAMSTVFAQTESVLAKLGASVGTGVKLVTDLDMSKKKPAAIKNQSSADSEYAGASCIEVTSAKARLVRFAFVFDEPVSTDDLANLKFSMSGFNGYEGFWNMGLMYEDMNGGEHSISCYTANVRKEAWTDYNFDLTKDEKWNKAFKPGKKVIAIQFYSDQTKTVYIKDVELIKK
ncbi:MAG: hypothetical protein K6C97_05720 [Treponema sp.]|nr:hypothetical protein [Treponema sp.]